YWRGAGQRERLVDVGMLGAGMIAIRRTALVDIRFDARYRGASLGEDLDLSWALRARGGTLAIATDAHVIHRKAPRPASRRQRPRPQTRGPSRDPGATTSRRKGQARDARPKTAGVS